MRMLIAGGGTGGHLFPGVALAEELTTRQTGNAVLFVGTQRGIEARVVPDLGYDIRFIDVLGLKRKGLLGLVKGLWRLPRSLFQSLKIVREFQPDIAVGVGGYASGPMILAAWLLRCPTAVLEQNSVPGVTNKILSRLVDAVFTSFEHARRFFPLRKVMLLGNPVRRQLVENILAAKVSDDAFTVLILGGSQGAHALNLRMLEAAGHLGALEGKIRFHHQTGTKDYESVEQGYEQLGLSAEVVPFIEDMSAAYRRADLVVCRAGATTIAELQVAAKAAIFVPYPFAADDHQKINASEMVDAGAAIMILEDELDGPKLAGEIRGLYEAAGRIRKMEQAASRAGKPQAAREIVDACAELAGGRT